VRVRDQPLAKQPMPEQLRTFRPEHMEICARVVEPQESMLVPCWLASTQDEAGAFERWHICSLVDRISQCEVDVDDRLGSEPWDRGRADVLDREHCISERHSNACDDFFVLGWPAHVVVDDQDRCGECRFSDPRIVIRWGIPVLYELFGARHGDEYTSSFCGSGEFATNAVLIVAPALRASLPFAENYTVMSADLFVASGGHMTNHDIEHEASKPRWSA
jgi:hypothetical protein